MNSGPPFSAENRKIEIHRLFGFVVEPQEWVIFCIAFAPYFLCRPEQPLPDGRGSECGCKRLLSILSQQFGQFVVGSRLRRAPYRIL